MPYLTISDQTTPPLRIFYLDQGPPTSQPMLLIHGLGCDLHDWSWQIPLLLSLGYRVISSDLRGHGKSSGPHPTLPLPPTWPGPEALSNGPILDYYPQSLAHDQIRLLDHLSISESEKVLVIGHSLGSTISYYLYTTFPDRVKGLVTIDPFHNQTNEMRDPIVGMFDSDGEYTLVEWFTKYGYIDMSPPPEEWYTTWHARRVLTTESQVMRGLAWGGFEAKDSLGRRENAALCYLTGGKEGLQCPFLAVGAGEQNLILEREMLKSKGNKLDEVVVLARGGHWLHQGHKAGEFNKILEGWLRKGEFLPDSVGGRPGF
ncbi:alpha/beta hydrolase protein [Rhypophila decipiens]|uniref:Alpha/beta hydrolase protein n=1 Tax=Rhypophila decipiens TaxID=261697 RepID=A0AAN6Y3A4_9PEZI|nr:alpha/beta hydrolase protein [Rhypophila decipiens]